MHGDWLNKHLNISCLKLTDLGITIVFLVPWRSLPEVILLKVHNSEGKRQQQRKLATRLDEQLYRNELPLYICNYSPRTPDHLQPET